MTTCHLITHPDALDRCKAFLYAGDVVVFAGAGVQCQVGTDWQDSVRWCYLEADVKARGLVGALPSECLIDYDQWVALLVSYDKQVAWS